VEQNKKDNALAEKDMLRELWICINYQLDAQMFFIYIISRYIGEK
jgi:hypothetical protein